jgi:hypothetical protein
MAEVPANEKLYAMVVSQAKQKYRIYPSPGASHWVHRRYLELGGRMVDSEDLARRKEAMEHFMERRRELRAQHHDHTTKSKDKDKKSKKDK